MAEEHTQLGVEASAYEARLEPLLNCNLRDPLPEFGVDLLPEMAGSLDSE